MLNKQQQQKNCGAPSISKNTKVFSGTNNGSFVEFSSFPTFAAYGRDLTQKSFIPNLFLINNTSRVYQFLTLKGQGRKKEKLIQSQHSLDAVSWFYFLLYRVRNDKQMTQYI